MKLYGALEAGGTKMVCAIGDENGNILERISIPTRTPAETMGPMIDFFRGKGIRALGIGCFGPVDLKKEAGPTAISPPPRSWPGRATPLWRSLKKHWVFPWALTPM